MDLGSIFLILALAMLVGMFVGRPFFATAALQRKSAAIQAQSAAERDHELSSLMAERDRVLNALQDLDFDHSLGKIPEEDYPGQRSMLLQRGADVLRRIDELEGIVPVSSTNLPAQQEGVQAPELDDAEDRLEAVIAARRVDGAAGAAVANKAVNGRRGIAAVGGDDDIETLLAHRRRERKEKAAGFCPQCGGPVQVSDRFCPRCGVLLEA